MQKMQLVLALALLLLSIGKGNAGSTRPCQSPGDCKVDCGKDGKIICIHNTCVCQKCTNFFPPNPSDESFVPKTNAQPIPSQF
ncbi:hypothetical protein P3S67_003783 [Capsicum chacoense]